MYVRIIKGRTKQYVTIVRGYRDIKGKVKQKLVYNLGPILSEQSKKKLITTANNIISSSRGELIENFNNIDISKIKEISREKWGASIILDKLWSEYGLLKILKTNTKAIELMVLERILNPCSKLATFKNRDKYSGFKFLNLHDLYRGLDKLEHKKIEIKKQIISKQLKRGKFNVILFDVTTMYFESCKRDELKDFGFGKDGKFNEVQIVLSLIVNPEGMPLTYEIFKGNTFEGKTLEPCLEELKKILDIDKVIVVADRGIGSFNNLNMLKERGYEYFIGSRLRSKPKTLQEEVLTEEGYIALGDDEDLRKYKFIDNKQYICVWSFKRALKDKADREKLLEKAKKLKKSDISQNKKGAKRYIKPTKHINNSYELDIEKYNEDARYDGYYMLSVSDKNLSAIEIINAYHNLWKIEDSFRTMKTFLETRPIFHWTPRRISAHILLNFIALVFETNLKLKLLKNNLDISHMEIRQEINNLERSKLLINDFTMYLYSGLTNNQKSILKILDINIPKNTKVL